MREVLVRHVGEDRPDEFSALELAGAQRQGHRAGFQVDMGGLHQENGPEETRVHFRRRRLGHNEMLIGKDRRGRRPRLVQRRPLDAAHEDLGPSGEACRRKERGYGADPARVGVETAARHAWSLLWCVPPGRRLEHNREGQA
jgi:hypothetical protein